MKKSKADIISELKAFIGDNNSDEAISLIENVSDSINENDETEELRKQLEEQDKAWRQRYIDRFNNEESEETKKIINVDTGDDSDDSNDKPLTFENLFEEG